MLVSDSGLLGGSRFVIYCASGARRSVRSLVGAFAVIDVVVATAVLIAGVTAVASFTGGAIAVAHSVVVIFIKLASFSAEALVAVDFVAGRAAVATAASCVALATSAAAAPLVRWVFADVGVDGVSFLHVLALVVRFQRFADFAFDLRCWRLGLVVGW